MHTDRTYGPAPRCQAPALHLLTIGRVCDTPLDDLGRCGQPERHTTTPTN